MSTSTTIRSTVRTIERGVRCGPKSQSQNNLTITARSSSGHRSSSPAVDHVKQQLCAFIDQSQIEKCELAKLNDRMSSYVNRVKCLECENQKLMCNIHDVQVQHDISKYIAYLKDNSQEKMRSNGNKNQHLKVFQQK